MSKQKSAAFFIRYKDGKPQLLVLTLDIKDYPFYRIPGGNAEPGESPVDTLRREVGEETGILDITIVRLIGVHKYYKEYLNSWVERTDFLVTGGSNLPDTWEYRVQGTDEDQGHTFNYSWIEKDRFGQIDPELTTFLNPENIPELF
ncbi:MAG TPA: NUDIX hydrolase [Bacillota bacterium]|nr:NUDIX hydrolase [Bacillota bacterium]